MSHQTLTKTALGPATPAPAAAGPHSTPLTATASSLQVVLVLTNRARPASLEKEDALTKLSQ